MSIQEEAFKKYIGRKRVKKADLSEHKTASGLEIATIEFEDETVEQFSSLILPHILTSKPIDLSELREKRIQPIVGVVLQVLRDWGIKMGELQYFSVLLQNSLDFNHNEAIKELWKTWMPKPSAPDEVDLLTVDRVLKAKEDGK